MNKFALIFILFFIGCSPLEFCRLLGTGTKVFREKGKIYSKNFDKDFSFSYDEVVKILRELGTNYSRGKKEKGFIIVTNFDDSYRFCTEATEIAVFFKEIEENKTQIEVACLNPSLAEYASTQIFNALDGKPIYKLEKIIKEGEEKEEE
ncbi:MAG: hypothetical protein ABIH08_07720 [Candidatus Omnitrophota bacterium]